MTPDNDQPPSELPAPHPVRQQCDGQEPVDADFPDVTSPEFAAEAHRQSALVANSPHAQEEMAFIESLADETMAMWDAEDGGWTDLIRREEAPD